MNRDILISVYPYREQLSVTERTVNEEVSHVISTDMMPRTISGLQDFRRQNPQFDDEAINKMADSIWGYLSNPAPTLQDQFDEWHHSVCEQFLNNYNTALSKKNALYQGNAIRINYGKAQKVVNMTLKNIFSMGNGASYKDHFIYCHMPLDRYTYGDGGHIGWYENKVGRFVRCWSNLSYEEYIDIQKGIRRYLLNHSNDVLSEWDHYCKNMSIRFNSCDYLPQPFSPFESEFLIWSMYH